MTRVIRNIGPPTYKIPPAAINARPPLIESRLFGASTLSLYNYNCIINLLCTSTFTVARSYHSRREFVDRRELAEYVAIAS